MEYRIRLELEEQKILNNSTTNIVRFTVTMYIIPVLQEANSLHGYLSTGEIDSSKNRVIFQAYKSALND